MDKDDYWYNLKEENGSVVRNKSLKNSNSKEKMISSPNQFNSVKKEKKR